MNATTVAVDVAKNVFELAVANAQWRVVGSARLTRGQFARWFDNRQVELVIMDACGSRYLADEHSGLPALLRASMRLMLEEIRLLEARIGQLECERVEIANGSSPCQALLSVSGIGLLTSTAMVAAVGDPRSFDSARRFASLLGLTPREHSSGDKRVLGGISKRGDRYHKADNFSDRCSIARNVWLSVRRFHVGTSATTLTQDAGYTTATDPRVELLNGVSLLASGGVHIRPVRPHSRPVSRCHRRLLILPNAMNRRTRTSPRN
jgi:transposase